MLSPCGNPVSRISHGNPPSVPDALGSRDRKTDTARIITAQRLACVLRPVATAADRASLDVFNAGHGAKLGTSPPTFRRRRSRAYREKLVHMTPGSALARTRAEGPVTPNARGSTLVPSVELGPLELVGATSSACRISTSTPGARCKSNAG
jgi:hypothetical protein